MKKTIVITAGDNITEAIVLKLIELLSTSKVDVHHASLHAGKDITPIIGTLDDAPPITSLVTMGSPNSKAMPVTLESLDLKVTAVLDEVRAFRTYEEEEDEDDPKAPKKRKAHGAISTGKKKGPPAAEDKPATPEIAPTTSDAATPQAGEAGASAQTQEAEGLAGELAEVLGKSTDTTTPPEA